VPGVSFSDARGPEGMRVYAIGDAHGRIDLLEKMHEMIAADRSKHGAEDWRIVHLGDYVDRGPASRGVIEFLIEAMRADSRNLALAGNHDIGFVEFLVKPDPASLFAQHGGVETARSYGVELDFGDPDAFARSHREFFRAVPRSHTEFLGQLQFMQTFGDFFFCHAGIRPGVALDAQAPDDLIWIRGEFHRYEPLHPKVIVHGHTPVRAPDIRPNRVNLDTGAYQSGLLSALVIDGRDKQILQVSDRELTA